MEHRPRQDPPVRILDVRGMGTRLRRYIFQDVGFRYASDRPKGCGCTAWSRGDDVSLESCILMRVGNATNVFLF
jgi:hypothetical protein